MREFCAVIATEISYVESILKRLPESWSVTAKTSNSFIAAPREENLNKQNGADFRVQISVAHYQGKPLLSNFWHDFDNKNNAAPCLELDGHFLLARVIEDRFEAITDLGGSIPLFYAHTNEGFFASTNPNMVASLSKQTQPDPVSINDFILNGSICHPYSWFENVRVAEPASVTQFSRQQQRITTSPYWKPNEERLLSLQDAAVSLQKELKENVARTAQGHSSIGILASGGEDARVLTALIKRDHVKNGYIFLKNKNREYTLARLIAQSLNVNLQLLERASDHYLLDLKQKQQLVGYGTDLYQAHAYGLADKILDPVVIGGWGSDTLLKSSWVGKFPPLRDKELQGPYSQQVEERRAKRRQVLSDFVHTPKDEWQMFWPLSGHKHYGNFAISRRLLPMREPYLYCNILRIAAAMSIDDKLTRQLFPLAFKKDLGLAGWIPTGTARLMLLTNSQADRIKPLIKLGFSLQNRLQPQPSGQGPWSNRPEFLETNKYEQLQQANQNALLTFDKGRFAEWQQRFSTLKKKKSAPYHHLFLQTAMALNAECQSEHTVPERNSS